MGAKVTTDVLIVGAGPTGLALAVQLIRYGIDFTIVDKREGTTPYSKAIGVQARTLEIYQQIDLADRLIEMGLPAQGVRLLEGGEERAEVPLSSLGQGKSPYPFLLIVEQGKHEALLYEFIKLHGHDVRWQTTFDRLKPNFSSLVMDQEVDFATRLVSRLKAVRWNDCSTSQTCS
jgi:2-polyprenyl-6-methoxyphenol hydroxylase-like FAD-dependent oxidoreductase